MFKTKSYVICTNWGSGYWILLSGYNCLDIDNEIVNRATREKLR